MSKKIILIIIVIGLISLIAYKVLKKEEPTFSLVEVVRGNVSQEVSETGQVQMGEELNLGFKNTGTIERIFVKVGDEVWPGTSLAKLNTTQLIIERNESQANLEIAQAKLDQLLAGSTPEEIQVAETAVDNAQTALEDDKTNLKNVEAKAEEDLSQAYEDALNVLDGSYLKGYNAFTAVSAIQRSYFTGNDQESMTVKEKKDEIENTLSEVEEYIDAAKVDSSRENTDIALSQLRNALSSIYNALDVIRNITEVINYRDLVSSTDKNSLDTQKLNVNTALTNVINSQQTIISTELANESNINTARSEVSSTQGKLKKAQDELLLKTADPRQVDIDLYQAQVRQAQAQADFLENQIQEATLKSPVKGQVVEISKRTGEIIQPTESVISLLPASPYEIKVDIYEEDIVKMKVGNQVDIALVALPDKTLKGKIISIDPAEKLIEGVVYYEININFEEVPQEIKPGMTADLTIKISSKEDVLIIPEEAIQEKDGKSIVQVSQDNQTAEREIEVGLMGSDDMVEVVSGLTEGEKVIVE